MGKIRMEKINKRYTPRFSTGSNFVRTLHKQHARSNQYWHRHILPVSEDTKAFRGIFQQSDCEYLQRGIHAIHEWSEKWLLCFHPDKCKVMRIGGSNGTEILHTEGRYNTDGICRNRKRYRSYHRHQTIF